MFARDTCALPSTYGQGVSMFGGSKSSMTSSEQQQQQQDDVTPNDRYPTTESASQHLHQPQQPGTNKVSALHRVANMLKEKLSREDGKMTADVTGHSQSVDVKIEHSNSNNNNNTMKETDSSSNDRDAKIKQSKDGASDEEEDILEAGEDEDIEENGSLADNEDEEDGADRHGDAMESSAICPPLMPASAASFEEMLLRENVAAAEFYRRAAAGAAAAAATNGDADGRQVTGDVRRPKRKQYIPQQHDATREHQRRLERSILQRQLTLMQQQLSQMQKRYMELLEREEEETGDGDGENMAGDNCSDNNDMPVDMGDSDEHEDDVKVIDVDEMDDEDADTRQAKRQQQPGDCTSDGISPPRKKLCAEGDEGQGYRSKTDENVQEHLTAASSSPIPAGGIGAGMPVASAARSDKQPRLWSLLDIANRADPARFSALTAAAGSAFSIVHDRLAPVMLGRQPGSDHTLPSTTGGVAKQQVSPTVGDTPADFQQLASVLKDEITSGISTIVESAVAKYAEKQQTVRHHRKDVIGHMTSASLLRHHPHHHRDTSDIVNHHESASVSSDRNLLQQRDNVDTKVPPLILDTGRLTSASESASTSTATKPLPWPASAKSPKKDFSFSTAAAVSATSSKPSSSSTLLGSQLFGDDFDSATGGGGALSDMRKHYMDLVRGPAKLHPPSFLPPHHPAFDFLHPPPATAAGFDLVRAAGLGPAPFSMPYFPPLHIPALPSMYGKEPEQTEALPLIVNTPKKKRTKVTDTRLSPRAARALLHEPAGPLRTSSGASFDFPFGGHTSVAGSHHHYHGGHHAPSTSSSHRRSPGEMSDSRPRSNPSLSSHVINDLSPDAAAGLFPGRGYPFSHSNLSLSGGLQPTDVFSALYKHHAAAVKDQRSPYLPFSSVLGIDGGKRESESPRSGEGRRGGDSLLQQQLADDSDLFEQDASSSESYSITSTLTPMHLRKAKLMFFYVRYPSSSILKVYFPDVKFNKNNTAQLVKWFSNFREFYYIQMEKYSRQALAEGVKMAEELVVTNDSELYRVLNLHYNRNNQIEVPDNFRLVVQLTLREFFKAIQAGKDLEQSWKKAIYKVIARADDQIPDFFKSPNWMEMLAEN